MKVYIAEKPSLGKALASELAKHSPVVDRGRAYQSGQDWTVCWAAGHIFENQAPDYYIGQKFPDATKGKTGSFQWNRDHLPIQPGRNGWPGWALARDKEKSDLFKAIKLFVGKASMVVNAGDVDREGQRLIDEILEELNYAKPVRRVLCTSNDEVTVARALADERDNADFQSMSQAALARNHADWYCGMNLSRMLTLTAREGGYFGVLPYGRVQTPVLGLIVKRDLAIENFKPVDFFALTAHLQVQGGSFKAKWKPHDGQAGLDTEGRLLDKSIAQQLQALVKGKQGTVIEYEDKEKGQGPPLPFSIDTLRVLGIRKYGMTADEVTKAVQALYDAKFVTYPRSDCSFLPVSQHAEAPRVLKAVQNNLVLATSLTQTMDSSRRSRAWNDSKVTAHHGIIPTGERVDPSALPGLQGAIYREIALRYAAQFMPDRRYRAVKALIDVAGQHFAASGSTTLSLGWKALYVKPGEVAEQSEEVAEGNDADGAEGIVLSPMKKGDAALCHGLDIDAQKTEPPGHYTEDTLIEAMVSIHKYVESDQIKAIFKKMFDAKKDGDEGACGLGTAATRQTFVPKLEGSGFIEKKKGKGKVVYLISTKQARAFIQALPADLSAPDMTALWEAALGEIEGGRNTYDRFMSNLIQWVDAKLKEIGQRGVSMPAVADVQPGKGAGRTAASASTKTNSGVKAKAGEKACPKCGSVMRLRQAPKGAFYGCSAYPKCKHTEDAAGVAA
ncbi:MAG: DNA topoisomerase [Rhodanobacter sp.]